MAYSISTNTTSTSTSPYGSTNVYTVSADPEELTLREKVALDLLKVMLTQAWSLNYEGLVAEAYELADEFIKGPKK